MFKLLIRTGKLAVLLSLAGLVRGAYGQEPEPLPPPKSVPEALMLPAPFSPFPGYYRRSRYDVWQYYAVDRSGHFRPRVILAPYGAAYYAETGQPYPWVITHPLDFMPYVVEQ